MNTITELYENLVSPVHYPLIAAIRWLAIRVLPTKEWSYSHPPEMVAGYLGGIDFAGKCLAFRRADGSLQYRW